VSDQRLRELERRWRETCSLKDARDDDRDEAPILAAFATGQLDQGANWPRPHRVPVLIRGALRAPAHGLQP